jgi:hypothetical protein
MCARSKIHAFNFMDPPEWYRTLIISLFHNSNPRKWFLMIGKGSSLRTNRFTEKCKNLQETRLFIRGFSSHATVLTNTKQLPIGQWLNASGVHLVN